MSERDYSNNWDDYWHDYPDGQGQAPGGVTPPQTDPFPDPYVETGQPYVPPPLPPPYTHNVPAFPPPPPPGPNPPPPTTTKGNGGGVPSINTGGGGGGGYTPINIPSPTLPTDILDLFSQKPTITPVQQAYQDALLKYMGHAQETPTLDDSILGPQTEVFRAANQRNTERQRRTAVERASAQGQNQSGYVDTLINDGVQKQGFNNAQYNANLLGGELSKRREELQAGLQLASATGNAEATRELQARLAQVSAALQQEGLNLQGQLGSGDLALRSRMADMSNSQFYDQLGINTQLNLEGLNQRALQIIMGGLS